MWSPLLPLVATDPPLPLPLPTPPPGPPPVPPCSSCRKSCWESCSSSCFLSPARAKGGTLDRALAMEAGVRWADVEAEGGAEDEDECAEEEEEEEEGAVKVPAVDR